MACFGQLEGMNQALEKQARVATTPTAVSLWLGKRAVSLRVNHWQIPILKELFMNKYEETQVTVMSTELRSVMSTELRTAMLSLCTN